MGGGGQSAEAAIAGLKPYLLGHDPLQFEQLRWKIMNPVASLYNNRTQLHAAIEFACIDVAGKKLGIRACDFLGGAVREEIPFASYIFYRYRDPDTGSAARRRRTRSSPTLATLPPATASGRTSSRAASSPRIMTSRSSARSAPPSPGDGIRLDPNSAWSVEESIRVGRAIEDLNNDYFEDPCWGLEGMRRLRRSVNIPTATNTVVVNFEQLAACIRLEAIDVILLDTTFWGGLRQAHKAGQVLETFQMGACVHSSGELGIQLATMLHLGAALPNLNFAADAHYHHLEDDVIKGGKMQYVDGRIALPKGPGLGVELDRDKLAEYAELYRALGGYAYDRDPGRPNWYAVMPERNYADPAAGAAMPW